MPDVSGIYRLWSNTLIHGPALGSLGQFFTVDSNKYGNNDIRISSNKIKLYLILLFIHELVFSHQKKNNG